MLAPSLQRRGLFCLLMTVSKPRKGGVAKSQKDKHLLSFIHPLLLPIPEIFYLHSSFFFKFIWYLFIYLLTLRCKSNKKECNYIQMYLIIKLVKYYFMFINIIYK